MRSSPVSIPHATAANALRLPAPHEVPEISLAWLCGQMFRNKVGRYKGIGACMDRPRHRTAVPKTSNSVCAKSDADLMATFDGAYIPI